MFCTSCGKELKDGTVFCTRCGKKVAAGNMGSTDSTINSAGGSVNNADSTVNSTGGNVNNTDSTINSAGGSVNNADSTMNSTSSITTENSDNEQRVEQTNGSQQYYHQPIYMQNNMNQQQRQLNGYQNQYQYGNQYTNQGYRPPMNNSYGITPEKLYKRSILPFKIVSAIMNLLTLGALAIISLVAIALEEEDFNEYFKSSWVDGFQTYGFIAFFLVFALFILVILGFALPAKAGVSMNLLASFAGLALLIWGMVLFTGLLSKVNHYINDFGLLYKEDAKPLTIFMMAICIVAIFMQIISLLFSFIGLAKKKTC